MLLDENELVEINEVVQLLTEGAWRQGSFHYNVKHRANVPVDTSFFIRKLISVKREKIDFTKDTECGIIIG